MIKIVVLFALGLEDTIEKIINSTTSPRNYY